MVASSAYWFSPLLAGRSYTHAHRKWQAVYNNSSPTFMYPGLLAALMIFFYLGACPATWSYLVAWSTRSIFKSSQDKNSLANIDRWTEIAITSTATRNINTVRSRNDAIGKPNAPTSSCKSLDIAISRFLYINCFCSQAVPYFGGSTESTASIQLSQWKTPLST